MSTTPRCVDIYGEPTTNPDAMAHCTKCHKLLDAEEYSEDGECVCGADLTAHDAISTGRMLRAEIERVDAEMAEWTRLNTTKRNPMTIAPPDEPFRAANLDRQLAAVAAENARLEDLVDSLRKERDALAAALRAIDNLAVLCRVTSDATDAEDFMGIIDICRTALDDTNGEVTP